MKAYIYTTELRKCFSEKGIHTNIPNEILAEIPKQFNEGKVPFQQMDIPRQNEGILAETSHLVALNRS